MFSGAIGSVGFVVELLIFAGVVVEVAVIDGGGACDCCLL